MDGWTSSLQPRRPGPLSYDRFYPAITLNGYSKVRVGQRSADLSLKIRLRARLEMTSDRKGDGQFADNLRHRLYFLCAEIGLIY
jgi:hypothetical protein